MTHTRVQTIDDQVTTTVVTNVTSTRYGFDPANGKRVPTAAISKVDQTVETRLRS